MNPSTAVGQLAPYLQLFGLFAIVALYPLKREDFYALAGGTMAGGFIAAAIGIFLYSHGQDVSHGRLYVQFGGRAIDENHNAASLLMPLMLALIVALRAQVSRDRLALWAVVLTIVAGIVLTGSRGGFVAMVAGTAMLLLRTRFRLPMLFGIVGISLAGASSVLSSRLSDVVSSGGAGRFEIWASAWQAFQEHWLGGVGIGNFQDAYDSVYLDVYHPSYSHWHMVAHNLIAQTSVELGIIGLFIVGLCWIVMLRDPPRSLLRGDFADFWRAVQGGLVALLCASMFVDLAWYKDLWLGFMLAVTVKNTLAVHEPELGNMTTDHASLREIRSVEL
jgi:O-antigen ligase